MSHAGIYIHIPFCLYHCSYCDFATAPYEQKLAERYVRSVALEISNFDTPDISRQVDTIYFGGGTPSLLTPAQLEALLNSIHDQFEVSKSPEVTIEMNPGGLGPAVLRRFRRLGVNRVSFGAQTFDDDQLKRLGRRHTGADVHQTLIDLRKEGFENISFDLIAGLPSQTLESWSRNVEKALQLRPEHFSLYLLEIHEGTPLAQQIARGAESKPDDDTAAAMYRLMVARARAAGYEHYEISNFALAGYEARHNTKYWSREPVYGFGCSAHSFDGHRRRWSNERSVTKYIDVLARRGTPVVETVELTDSDEQSEVVFLGLRLFQGLSFAEYSSRFGEDLRLKHEKDLARLNDAGLISINDGVLRLTQSGALLSNEVFSIFV